MKRYIEQYKTKSMEDLQIIVETADCEKQVGAATRIMYAKENPLGLTALSIKLGAASLAK